MISSLYCSGIQINSIILVFPSSSDISFNLTNLLLLSMAYVVNFILNNFLSSLDPLFLVISLKLSGYSPFNPLFISFFLK